MRLTQAPLLPRRAGSSPACCAACGALAAPMLSTATASYIRKFSSGGTGGARMVARPCARLRAPVGKERRGRMGTPHQEAAAALSRPRTATRTTSRCPNRASCRAPRLRACCLLWRPSAGARGGAAAAPRAAGPAMGQGWGNGSARRQVATAGRRGTAAGAARRLVQRKQQLLGLTSGVHGVRFLAECRRPSSSSTPAPSAHTGTAMPSPRPRAQLGSAQLVGWRPSLVWRQQQGQGRGRLTRSLWVAFGIRVMWRGAAA